MPVAALSAKEKAAGFRFRGSAISKLRLNLARACIVVFAALPAQAAAAFDWCALERLMPSVRRSFEVVAAQVSALPGCAGEATTSAHEKSWRCPGASMDTLIMLKREPGRSPVLVIIAPPMESLDALRSCGGSARGERTFDAGSIVRRDSLAVDYIGSIMLLSEGPASPALVVAGNRSDVTHAVAGIERSVYRMERSEFPSTSVRVAGVDIVRAPASDLIAALRGRGAELRRTADGDTSVPQYFFSAPVGLPGVREVKIDGVLAHVWAVTYEFESAQAYEQFIILLDQEYGRSTRRAGAEGCTERTWTSGDVSIQGQFCPSGSRAVFVNRVANQQLVSIGEARRARSNRPSEPTPRRPDRDNY